MNSKQPSNLQKGETESINNINYKIEVATQTLERNLGFISNCDNKTSIVLTAIGVLLTIILTNDGIIKINNILKSCLSKVCFCDIIYIILFIGSTSMLIVGILFLISVLVARADPHGIEGIKNNNSVIFFSGVNSYKDLKNYNKTFKKMSKDNLLDELISQIYINSEIATKKYKRYNLGLKFTIIGFFLFITILIIGIYAY